MRIREITSGETLELGEAARIFFSYPLDHNDPESILFFHPPEDNNNFALRIENVFWWLEKLTNLIYRREQAPQTSFVIN
ncbi:MAG: hypothetical protein QNJ31_02205 [Candidatus Caenarcaniphilales bacterium]|nr:hypothetical protein [Candidatus Caenarcaniphilales bacterium]